MKRIIADVSRWSCFLHRTARGLDRADDADHAPSRIEDEVFERLYSGPLDWLAEEERRTADAVWAEKIHAACDQLGDFGRLAAECRGDAIAAATALESVLDELRPALDEAADLDGAQLRRLLRSSCARASVAVEELRDAVEGLAGVGFGNDRPELTAGNDLDGDPARRLARRLRDDEQLKKLAILAGRFRRIAATKRRTKVRRGAEEVVDVEQGGDVARLLPVELARIAHPRLRLSALRDVLEQNALQYRLEGTDTLGKGPIVVCLDKSSSMAGPPDLWATAVALALLGVAREEGRTFALLAFDAGLKFEAVVAKGDGLPEHGLFVPCDGGTDIDGVLVRALDIVAEHPGDLSRADVVLITDGECDSAGASVVRQRAADLGVTILGLGIGIDPPALAPWCDQACSVADLGRLEEVPADLLFGN